MNAAFIGINSLRRSSMEVVGIDGGDILYFQDSAH